MTVTIQSGYEEIEHTADWSLRVWAPDLPGLLEQAARGMLALCGIQLAAGKRIQRQITVEAGDAEGLLVNFLAELLHILDQEALAFDVYLLTISENTAVANLGGAAVNERKKEIKAVTYHNLKIQKSSGRFEAVIVFDV